MRTVLPFFPKGRAGSWMVVAAALACVSCSKEIECKTEVTNGVATFVGRAKGKEESVALRRESVRDACRQKCAAEKSPMIDACAAACGADITAQKLGGRTTCGTR